MNDTLDVILAELGPDEREVLRLVALRLRVGAKEYGRLDVAGDDRTWRAELREELLDAIVYQAIGALADERVRTAEALTATQARCTELLEEVRALRRRCDAKEETHGQP